MSNQQLATAAMSLPLPDRVSLAQLLWESIDFSPELPESEVVEICQRRDQELSSGEVRGRTHEEVMLAARRAIGCA